MLKRMFAKRGQYGVRSHYPIISGASVDDDAGQEDADPADDKPTSTAEKVTFSPEQQRQVDKLVGRAKADARKAAEADAKREIEQSKLEAKEEFEKLYITAKSELDDLKPKYRTLEERVESLEDAIATYLAPQIEKLGTLEQALIKEQPVLRQIELLSEYASDDTDGTRPTVPPSNTKRREQKVQPIGQEALATNRKRIRRQINERIGNG